MCSFIKGSLGFIKMFTFISVYAQLSNLNFCQNTALTAEGQYFFLLLRGHITVGKFGTMIQKKCNFSLFITHNLSILLR